jgi:TRAP-type C4-dicarboxylate transport system permease small subunit
MNRVIPFTDAALRAVLIVVGIGMVACVTWQVASRYLFNAPSVITDEIGRFLLMWFALLSAAYVLGQRRHLAISLFGDLAAGPTRRWLSVGMTVVIAAFVGAVMIYGGLRLTLQTLASGQVTPTLRLPMGAVYAAAPISGVLMLLYCIDILRTALGPDALGPNDPIAPSAAPGDL